MAAWPRTRHRSLARRHRLPAFIRPFEHLEGEFRYEIVLLLVVAAFVFAEIAPDENWAQLVNLVLQAGALVVVLVTSRARRVVLLVFGAMAVLVIGLGVLTFLEGGDVSSGAVKISSGVFAWLAPLFIFAGVLRLIEERGAVTGQAVLGVLAIYLLIGMGFGYLYGAAQSISDTDFYASGEVGSTQDNLYFSFTTLTSTGYGDLTPVTRLGRTLAVIEALIGQIYLVTVVGLIVGNMRGGTGARHRGRRLLGPSRSQSAAQPPADDDLG